MSYNLPIAQIRKTGVTANTTVSIPPGYAITNVVIENTTANAVTGGVRIGTTDGGTDVAVAVTVGASAFVALTNAALLKQVFSMSASQTLYIQTVTAWNSANLSITFMCQQILT